MKNKQSFLANQSAVVAGSRQEQMIERLRSCIEYTDISDLIMNYYKNQ
jgi:hypothetical protein